MDNKLVELVLELELVGLAVVVDNKLVAELVELVAALELVEMDEVGNKPVEIVEDNRLVVALVAVDNKRVAVELAVELVVM